MLSITWALYAAVLRNRWQGYDGQESLVDPHVDAYCALGMPTHTVVAADMVQHDGDAWT